MLSLLLRGGAVRQLVGLITQRSLVQIRPPLLAKSRGYGTGCNPFFVAGVHIGVQSADRRPLIVWSEVGITERHSDVFMAKEFLHGHEVNARHHQVRGKSMPQVIEDKSFHVGLCECPSAPFPNVY